MVASGFLLQDLVPGVAQLQHLTPQALRLGAGIKEVPAKSDHKPLIPSLLREKQADSPRQQHALSYLAEVTDNFVYLKRKHRGR